MGRMSSRKASQVPEKSGWLCLDGSSAPPPEDGILQYRTPQEQEEDVETEDDSSGDEPDRQERISKELQRTPQPRPSRPVIEGDDEEEEDASEISLSLGGLSLLDAFVPSENDVEVRVVVYDLETTGLGATDKISIMELG